MPSLACRKRERGRKVRSLSLCAYSKNIAEQCDDLHEGDLHNVCPLKLYQPFIFAKLG